MNWKIQEEFGALTLHRLKAFYTGTGILQELAFRVIWVLPYCVLMLFMVFKVGVI